MEKIARIFSRHHVTVTFLLIALCLSIVTPTLIQFSTAADSSDSADSVPKQLDDKSNYLPVVPPEPYTYDGPIEPLIAGYELSTGEETFAPSTDPSEVSDELRFTEPNEGLLAEDMTPETVFPPDGRSLVSYSTTTTYPWRTVCKLYVRAADGSGWMGSGAIIGPGQGGHGYWMLTAGHMVYMHDNGGWVSQIEVIPGYDGVQAQKYEQMPYYHAFVVQSWTYVGWVNNRDHRYDIAWCRLDRNIGDFTGWMGRMTAGYTNPIYTGILNTAGYPGDKDGGKRMYFDSDYGRTANEYNHWYYMDTAGGQSGSPVWLYDGTSRYILTVHAYGNDGSGSNHGTRLRSTVFDDLIYYLTGGGSVPPPTDKADLTDDGQTWSGFSPTTVYAGVTSFTVWCDVRNFGTKASGGFYVYYYASTDTTITTSDYLIGTDYISNVNAFAYADSDWSGTFPANIPEGSYWVGWIIDRTNLVSEFDEGNNIAYKTAYKLTVYRHTITFYTDPTTIGSITFAGTTYTNGLTGKYAAGSYTVTANAPSGWAFSYWVTTGGVSISGSTATVTGAGTIKAVFTSVGPTFDIWTDKTVPYPPTYHIGETMKVYVRVKNPGAALPVRALIFLKLPSGALYGPLLDLPATLPAGFDSGNYLWQSFTIPSAPFGTYAWVAELRNPTTNALITSDTWNWLLSP